MVLETTIKHKSLMYHPEIVGAHCKLAARYRPFIHSSEYAMPCWLVVSALLRWSHHPAPCTSGMYHHSLGSVSLRLPGWYQFHRDLGLQWYQGGILYRFDIFWQKKSGYYCSDVLYDLSGQWRRLHCYDSYSVYNWNIKFYCYQSDFKGNYWKSVIMGNYSDSKLSLFV